MLQAVRELDEKLGNLRVLLHLDEKEKRVQVLSKEAAKPDFWNKQEHARAISKQLGDVQSEVGEWQALRKDLTAVLEIAELDEKDQGVNLREELETQYKQLKTRIDKLEFLALLHGPYDSNNAILTFHAGAGGTEAQDWTGMLVRMYLRYAEAKGWNAIILDEHRGQEAGYKSLMMRVEGPYAYGYLKSEHGVHRLVRISPFDAEKMRHTSFALVEVLPELNEDIAIDIDPKDLRIDTFMAGGHGGQSVNTTYSAVRIVHIPTGITVSCQNERSQLQNKATAMNILKAKLHAIEREKQAEEKQELRGEYQSAAWGNQIRSYVVHPYKMVKDLRTRYETQDTESVLNGDLDPFIEAYLQESRKKHYA